MSNEQEYAKIYNAVEKAGLFKDATFDILLNYPKMLDSKRVFNSLSMHHNLISNGNYGDYQPLYNRTKRQVAFPEIVRETMTMFLYANVHLYIRTCENIRKFFIQNINWNEYNKLCDKQGKKNINCKRLNKAPYGRVIDWLKFIFKDKFNTSIFGLEIRNFLTHDDWYISDMSIRNNAKVFQYDDFIDELANVLSLYEYLISQHSKNHAPNLTKIETDIIKNLNNLLPLKYQG